MGNILLPLGRENIPLSIDNSINYKIIKENQLPIIKDVKQERIRAIKYPINNKRITEIVLPNDRVAIIVTDIREEPAILRFRMKVVH